MAFPATVMENPQRKCADHGKIILNRHSDEKVNSAQIFGKYPPPTCLIDVRILGKVYIRIMDPIGWAKSTYKTAFRQVKSCGMILFNKWNDKTHVSTLSL